MVRRRLISMLSALALVLTLFTLLPEGALKAHALSGTGTQSDPFIVTNYDDLHNLLSWERRDKILQWYHNINSEVYIKLGEDIVSEDKQSDYEIYTNFENTIHLDLAGHKLCRYTHRTCDGYLIDNIAATWIIEDTVGGGLMEIDMPLHNDIDSYLIKNSENLIIKGGTFSNKNPYFQACTIGGSGNTIVYDGNFRGECLFSNNSCVYGGNYDHFYIGGNAKMYGGKISNYHLEVSGLDSCTIYNAQVTLETEASLIYSATTARFLPCIYNGAKITLDGKTVSRDDISDKRYIRGKSLVISTPIATHATIYTPDLVHGGKAEAVQVSGGLGFIMHENCITGWRDLTEGKDMQLGDTFTGGHKYRLGVTIGTQDGYVIGKTPDIFTSIDNAKITSVEKLDDFFCNVILEIDCPKTTVSTVNVTLTEPAAGVAINETMQSATAGIDVARSTGAASRNLGRWYHGETMMTEGEKFAAGETYTALFRIRPLTGYELASNPIVKVNGDTATYVKTEGIYRTYEISYTVASSITTVSTVRIYVTEPEAGEIPEDATVFALPGKVPATVRTAWYHGDTQMASGEKFIAGETYTVKLLITRKASYEFSSPLKVFINNERVTSTNNSYSAVAEKSFTVESGQRLVGDANGDGLISADDAIIVARYAANYGNYQATYNANVCDMNRDGHVTADDAIIIARYAARYGNYRDIYTNYV